MRGVRWGESMLCQEPVELTDHNSRREDRAPGQVGVLFGAMLTPV
jgi:hypothetical protein